MIEVELFFVDHDGHVEGEHQLVHLEYPQTGVFVDVQRQLVDEVCALIEFDRLY